MGAPPGAVFIWYCANTAYPLSIAKKLNRDDITIVSPDWLDSMLYLGATYSQVIADHYALDCGRINMYKYFDAIRCQKVVDVKPSTTEVFTAGLAVLSFIIGIIGGITVRVFIPCQ